jgi:hypothetical protein
VSRLPASWGTLNILACIPEDLLEEMIEDGAVHPGLMRKDAERLVGYQVLRPLFSAIRTLLDTSRRYDARAVAANLRRVLEGAHLLTMPGRPFYDLDRLSAWIAAFHKEWEQADTEQRCQEADEDESVSPPPHRTAAKARLNGKEAAADA